MALNKMVMVTVCDSSDCQIVLPLPRLNRLWNWRLLPSYRQFQVSNEPEFASYEFEAWNAMSYQNLPGTCSLRVFKE